VQEAEALCLQRELYGRRERRPYHDRSLGRQGRARITLRH